MDIFIPWPPFIMLLVVSFFSIYLGLKLCRVEKPAILKVVLCALIPWVLAVAVVWLVQAFSSQAGGAPYQMMMAIYTIIGYFVVQFLLMLKLFSLGFKRTLLVFGVSFACFIAFALLWIIYIRVTD